MENTTLVFKDNLSINLQSKIPSRVQKHAAEAIWWNYVAMGTKHLLRHTDLVHLL